MTEVLAALAVLLGAALASATGFGFSLLCAPVLFALIGPAPAIGLLIVLGAEVNALDSGQVRDTLTLCFLCLSPIGALALLVTGTRDALPDAALLALLVPATLAGQLAGRRAFARLAASERYEPVLTAVLLGSVCAGLAGAVAS
jgi:uncharacterized membrane protein YfcA